MSRLPRITGREVLRALERAGFNLVRIRGSHHYVIHSADPTRRATVPIHSNRVIDPPIMRSILRTAGLTAREFRQYL